MTATLTHVDTQSIVHSGVSTPTRKEVIRAIRDEALARGVRCSMTKANNFYQMLEKGVRKARKGFAAYHLTQGELDYLHPVLAVIMPAGVAVGSSGSAHEMINRRITRGRELGLMHTAIAGRGAVDCAIALEMQRA